jgi:phosphoglycolate phosphatase-like HAD superfamily hydrolase
MTANLLVPAPGGGFLRVAARVAATGPVAGSVGAVLLLFDIDGTLVRGATQAHQRVLDIAIREIHGAFPSGRPSAVSGRTDPWIVRDMLARDGIDEAVIDAHMETVLELAADLYRHKCPRDLSMFVLPGVVDGLRALAGDGHVFGLVTGNLEGIARLKLQRAGLGDAFFADAPGGFGSDDESRPALPLLAMERAGGSFPAAETVVIGDTPLDVACAHACSLRCVGVTTGDFDASALAGADAVVGALDEVPAVLASWAGVATRTPVTRTPARHA